MHGALDAWQQRIYSQCIRDATGSIRTANVDGKQKRGAALRSGIVFMQTLRCCHG
jgi:hypothetical protein